LDNDKSRIINATQKYNYRRVTKSRRKRKNKTKREKKKQNKKGKEPLRSLNR